MKTDLRRHTALINELSELFPAKTHGPEVPLDRIRYENGQRSVVEFLLHELEVQERTADELTMQVLGAPE